MSTPDTMMHPPQSRDARLEEAQRNDELRSDELLCDEVRAGSASAFAELWQRHHGEALGYARKLDAALAEDAVAEVMSAIYEALRNGAGPESSFRSYLLLSVRNRIFRGAKQRHREQALPESENGSETLAAELEVASGVESVEAARLVTEAVHALPERWRQALVLVEVQKMTLAQAGAELGLTNNGVSALLVRARAGLRRSWVAAHFSGSKLSGECSNVIEALGDVRWGSPGEQQRAWFERHIASCAGCHEQHATHAWIAQAVGLALLPLVSVVGAALAAGAKSGAAAGAHAAAHGVSGVGAATGGAVGGVAGGVASGTALSAFSAPLVLVGTAVALTAAASVIGVVVGTSAASESAPVTAGPNTGAPVTRLSAENATSASNGSGDATASAQEDPPLPDPSQPAPSQPAASPSSATPSAPLTPAPLTPAPPTPAPPTPATPTPLPPVAPVPAGHQRITGSAWPGARIDYRLSDGTLTTATADQNGEVQHDIPWPSGKPAFSYTVLRTY